MSIGLYVERSLDKRIYRIGREVTMSRDYRSRNLRRLIPKGELGVIERLSFGTGQPRVLVAWGGGGELWIDGGEVNFPDEVTA